MSVNFAQPRSAPSLSVKKSFPPRRVNCREDPTYITNYNNARTLIRKIDRDELLQVLVRHYLNQ